MLRTYYAYLFIAGGVLLDLVSSEINHWIVFAVAYALIALGGFELRRFSRWYFRMACAAAVCGVASVLETGMTSGAVSLLSLAAYVVQMVCLLVGIIAQRRDYELHAVLEYVLLALLALGFVGGVVLTVGAVGATPAFTIALTAVNLLGVARVIGTICAVFRMQKVALRAENEGW